MTAIDAAKVLAKYKFRDRNDWRPWRGGLVRGVNPEGEGRNGHECYIGEYEAVAVAERLEREDPNRACGGCGAYADDCDCPSLAAEVALVLEQLDHLAEVFGDEGVFRSCRDHLRAALAKERERSNA